jgi:hypothetical protein
VDDPLDDTSLHFGAELLSDFPTRIILRGVSEGPAIWEASSVGGTAGDDARQPNGTQGARRRRIACHIEFARLGLSAEIQTPSGPPSIASLIAHDQTDPGARDLWISQIDISPNQPRCALALCINEPSARSIIPVE